MIFMRHKFTLYNEVLFDDDLFMYIIHSLSNAYYNTLKLTMLTIFYTYQLISRYSLYVIFKYCCFCVT